MNRAIIDIGTNSVRLLEARKSETGEWDVVRKEINSTRLGEGMTESASIADGSRHRTLKAIEEFAAMARSDGFTDIRAYGTSVMRDAKEGSELLMRSLPRPVCPYGSYRDGRRRIIVISARQALLPS